MVGLYHGCTRTNGDAHCVLSLGVKVNHNKCSIVYTELGGKGLQIDQVCMFWSALNLELMRQQVTLLMSILVKGVWKNSFEIIIYEYEKLRIMPVFHRRQENINRRTAFGRVYRRIRIRIHGIRYFLDPGSGSQGSGTV